MGDEGIAASAFKHGVGREQILATLALPYRIVRISEDLVLTIGADDGGNFLEVITVDPQDSPTVIQQCD